MNAPAEIPVVVWHGLRRSSLGVWAPLPPLLAWIQWGGWWWVALAATAVLLALPASRRQGRLQASGVAFLILSTCAAAVGQGETERLAAGWDEWWEEREAGVALQLDGALASLLQNADQAAVRVASGVQDAAGNEADLLRAARSVTGVSALAVYDAVGELVAWDGEHQGPVPTAVRRWNTPYFYGHGPLFGYLYSIAPIPETGGVAMAALLMRADLPSALGEGRGDFAGTFQERIGEEIRITPADRAAGEAIWDLRWEGEVLFSVEVVPPSRSERLAGMRVLWGRIVLPPVALGWLLLISGASGAGLLAGAGALILGSVILPLGSLLGVPYLFAPAGYLLPGPGEITLGRLLALACAGIMTVALLSGREARRRVGVVPGLVVALVGFPAMVALLRGGASPDFLAGPAGGWVAFQGLLALGLTGVARLALLRTRERPGGEALLQGMAALIAALVLAGVLGEATRRVVSLPLWPALLWALPTVLAAGALGALDPRRRQALAWMVAAALGTSAALPYAWGGRVEARMAVAQARMESVGMNPDHYLEFLLNRLGTEAEALRSGGVDGLELLVDGWVASGVAAAGYPIRLTLWSPGGVPLEELRIGVTDPRPPVADNLFFSAAGTGGTVVRRFDLPDVHYVGLIPFADGTALTAVVPPLRGLGPPEPLGPLFVPELPEGEPLTLIPLLPGEQEGVPDGMSWIPGVDGWRGESVLAYPEGLYLARYALDFPPGAVAVARGGLLLVLNLMVVGLVWGTARLPRSLAMGWGGRLRMGRLLGSFRTRVTLVLFLFFLVPTLFFGTQAYRTLAGAAQRTAEALARRAVDDGASAFLEVQGEIDLLSRRVRADLLLYEQGSLVAGSPPELVDMGLFDGWLPGSARELMEGREEVVASSASAWGRWSYMVAYRRLPGGVVLASVAPLRVGTAALRSREVADLLVFSVVLGALLSLGLSLVAGRVLSRPIRVLQVASERVGSGNLRVRLPEDRTDEFGAVFGAFNRMVQRLRRARRDLVRTNRQTRAIVEEAATGVVALDADGSVALANPRAERLLGVPLVPGSPLPGGAEPREELKGWLDRCWRDGLPEAGTELLVEGRRIRVRVRRIARGGGSGGMVLSLEDVTDELRSERILAWGEMAQQVAHEVKNPLTPIKLAVQHIRRAWEDRHPDYDAILDRNVGAILGEIDRLAGIARGFSRFAAPQAAGEAPVEPVQLERVVDELLALYAHGDGPVRFSGVIPANLPPVRAREPEVKEVLVNLLENARAATGESGDVVMEAEEVADGVELRVRDTGSGIPPELLPRVFEPHFSTRSTGAGLGLAIVRRLVESWDGTVVAESTPDQGTTITMLLCRWGDDRRAATAPSPGRGAGGTGIGE